MPNVRTLARSFAGGEISPEMFGRIDLVPFQTGLALAENFLLRPHGPAVNRPGTLFVLETKTSSLPSRLIPFSFNTEQTFAIEFGDHYIRFHTNGATLESSPGVPYEVASPYGWDDVKDIHYVQSADVLTLVHPFYKPKELRRLAALNWTLTDIAFGTQVAAPTGTMAVATGPGGGNPRTFTYVVTASTVDGAVVDESEASAGAAANSDLTIAGNIITITWAASVTPGVTRYDIYKAENGVFGFIGRATGLSFVDNNIQPDYTTTPPLNQNPFPSLGNFPAAVTYYEQRRAFAATVNKPQTIWMTRSGTESNFGQSIPARDDDAVIFTIAAREVNKIRHLVPLAALIPLTASAEWRVQSTDNSAITPFTISAKPQSYTGANNVQPQVVGNNIVYARARGGRINEFTYTYDSQGGFRYQSADLSLMAPHLFQGKQIVDMAMAKAPYQILWNVSSGGDLVALTYVPEQKVSGWHHHRTVNGAFESVCVVGEGDEDAVYVIVRRTINGATKRYVERFHSREFTDLADAYFVDCGVTYDGPPIDTISGGLAHLEGQTVAILADGGVITPQVVTGGGLPDKLPVPASKIHIGLPITARMQTLPMTFETMAYGQGRAKNVNKVWLRLFETSGLWVGPSFEPQQMTQIKTRTTEPWGTPPAPVTDELEQVLDPSWNQNAGVCIEQRDPLPATISAMTLEAAIGG